ncbi:MAG: dGTP triphosphohydrolase [Planctomycetota bacterium]|jgi:dGTPase
MTWTRREDLEDRELHLLSPFAAQSRQCGGRRRAEPEDPLRTAFQRDRDRIIHSNAFRRLQHKTQVFAAHAGDHYRSRMTHSLEVSQMARGAAIALRLNPDLAEAVALAHDLGHPPFGHAGEDCLDALMQDEGGFRHNAQGCRIVDYLEDRYQHGFGLNLTLLVRRSLLKGRIPAGFPLSGDLLPREEPPLEADLVDKCDRIAYLCHDLDDALRAGIVQETAAGELGLWQAACRRTGSDSRQRTVSELVALLFQDLVSASDTEMTGCNGQSRPRIGHSDRMQVLSNELLAFLRERFYRSEPVLADMQAGGEKIRRLFADFLERPSEIPPKVSSRAERDGIRRVVCDYMAGMTDRFLLQQEV